MMNDNDPRATTRLLLLAIAMLILILAGVWLWRSDLQIASGLRWLFK
jgi:hypothetical protein